MSDERGISGRTAIVGIGQTEFSKSSGRSELQLAAECVTAALSDCGLAPADVDGFSSFTLDSTDEIELARTIGAGELSFFSVIPHGGGAACAVVQQAAIAVASGAADVVVAYRALNGRSGQRYSRGVAGGIVTSDAIHWGWYMPYGLMTPASWTAMFAQRYMHEYGATSEDLGLIAVGAREFAVTNPNAFFYGKPLTLEQHQASRWIVEPLHLYDCCQETDGGCAVVVTTVERARDLRKAPAVIVAAASGSGPDQVVMTSFYRDDMVGLPEAKKVGDQLWAQSRLKPDDIDVAVLYDAFTPNVLMQLERFGFCGRGEAKDFVRDGHLRRGGKLPANTHGGQLSEAYIHGINGVNEAVRQVRGEAVNQIDGVEHAIVTAGTGVPTSGLILARAS
jgi:acetyl-CoA acetyltransferase